MTVRPTPYVRKLPLGTEPVQCRQRLEALEQVLERALPIPGTNKRVGLDALLSLVPGVGSTVGAGLGAYLVWEGRNLGMSKWQIARMGKNIGFDWLLGMIPFVGVIPDFFFRSNTRNLRIIKKHLDKHHPATRIIDSSPLG
nr:DUF4112 domain-containing protein [uncultured Sphingomonas sp.]